MTEREQTWLYIRVSIDFVAATRLEEKLNKAVDRAPVDRLFIIIVRLFPTSFEWGCSFPGKRAYGISITFLPQYPKVHGIEFTWEKLTEKLNIHDCEQYNATGTAASILTLTSIIPLLD